MGRIGSAGGVVFDLDSESADRGRQALVVPDKQEQFDRLAVAETRLHGAPGRLGERALGEQLVGDRQQRSLTLCEAVRGALSATPATSSGVNPTRSAIGTCWCHSYAERHCHATRRITSSESRRGS